MKSANTAKTAFFALVLLIANAWGLPASAQEQEGIMIMPIKAKTEALELNIPDFTARVREYFKDTHKFVMLGADQLESLLGSASGNKGQLLQVAGEKIGCTKALVITLDRYRERLGDEYSASDPASLAFDYKLVNVADGRILCFGQFDETQKPVSENVLDIGQAYKRGFKWITVTELTNEALQRKFSSCPGLAIDPVN